MRSQSRLPANIELPDDLARTLQRLRDRSPTFKVQCERLALVMGKSNLHAPLQ